MWCPMCRGENCKVHNTKTAGSMFYCNECGYSRSHRTVNIFVELWLDTAEFWDIAHEGRAPKDEAELTALQKPFISTCAPK